MDASGRFRKCVPLTSVDRIHVSRQFFQCVEGAALRFLMMLNQVSDCWPNAVPRTDATADLSVSSLSAPLAVMISLALRSRAEAVRSPGPDVGQIFSRLF